MTKEEIKASLKQLKGLDNIISSNLRQADELRNKAENIGSFNLKMDCVTGGQQKDYSGTIDKIIDLSSEIDGYIDSLVDLKLFWKDKIKDLPLKQRLILENYYFENKTWEQVCVDTCYSWRSVHNLHSKALKYLEKKI